MVPCKRTSGPKPGSSKIRIHIDKDIVERLERLPAITTPQERNWVINQMLRNQIGLLDISDRGELELILLEVPIALS